jgi:hypothetical protein
LELHVFFPELVNSCHVKVYLLLYWLHNKQVTKGIISGPSDASFNVNMLAGTVRFEAVAAVSEGCCLCNYRSDIPEDTNLQEAHFAVQ